MQLRHVVAVLSTLFAALTCLPSLRAQCAAQWLPGEPRLTPAGAVMSSALWDPDGAGPLPLRYVIGGSFAVASTSAANVATWDGTQWTELAGLPGTVTALAVHNGQLHAAA